MGQYYKKYSWKLSPASSATILYLCEGESEAEYVDVWLSKKQVTLGSVRVLCFEGLSKIDSKISFLIKEPGYRNITTVCVFLDAEQDLNQRKRDVKKMLGNMDFPNSASEEIPWVESDGEKKSCVFISPDMKNLGRIENIVINELKSKKNIFGCIDEFGKCASGAGMSDFDEKKIVASYIILNKPGLSLGASFQKGLFDLNDPAYADLNFLLEKAIT